MNAHQRRTARRREEREQKLLDAAEAEFFREHPEYDPNVADEFDNAIRTSIATN